MVTAVWEEPGFAARVTAEQVGATAAWAGEMAAWPVAARVATGE